MHRRWLVTLAAILLALLSLSQGGQSSSVDVSSPSQVARKRAPAAGKRPKGAKPLSRPAGNGPALPVPGRRKVEVKVGGRKAAAPAAPQVEMEEVEEGLLEEAMRERSINKYFSADPLWTGQLIASGMAWFLVVRRDNEVKQALEPEDNCVHGDHVFTHIDDFLHVDVGRILTIGYHAGVDMMSIYRLPRKVVTFEARSRLWEGVIFLTFVTRPTNTRLTPTWKHSDSNHHST